MGRVKLSDNKKKKNYTFTLLESEVELIASLSYKRERTHGLRILIMLMSKLYESGKFSKEDVDKVIHLYG
jgi:hypothetical protein